MTGSKDWQQSGQQDKQAAVEEMRSASSDRKEAHEKAGGYKLGILLRVCAAKVVLASALWRFSCSSSPNIA